MTFSIGSTDECVVITGGTGSFGQAFTRYLLENTAAKIRILSRDEAKQENMRREIPDSRLTFILCDVRDSRKLTSAVDRATAIVHAAALKRVPIGERQSDEFVKTNIIGSENVISAALSADVPKTLLISSDKAVEPLNAYGKTKAVAESLFVQANLRGASRHVLFSAVRGGNVWGSRGSVIETWREQVKAGQPITISNPGATRFHLPMQEWCAFVWRALNEMCGGEIFVPALRAWKLGNLANEFMRLNQLDEEPYPFLVSGARDGDKPHETLIADGEAHRTLKAEWCYIIEPPEAIRDVWDYQTIGGRVLDGNFEYTSANARRLTQDELKEIVSG